MKKTLTIFLLLVVILVLESFFMTIAYASEEWNGAERESVTNLLKTTNRQRHVFAESNSDEITLHAKIEIDAELVLFWEGKNSDVLIIRLMTETDELVLTYYNDITIEEGPVGILNAEYSGGDAKTKQSAKLGYDFNSEITGINISIEFKNGCFFIDFEARIKSESVLQSNKEELKINAEEPSDDAAKLSFELISHEAPEWNPEVRIISTFFKQPPNTEFPQEEESPQGESPPQEAINEPIKQDQGGGASINFPETDGNETIYPIAIAAGGTALAAATAVLIIKNKRRKV